MGRGRQKAKQTKVARELKYYSPSTDYSALEKELSASSQPVFEKHQAKDTNKKNEYEDYSEYNEKYNTEPKNTD